MKEQDTRGYWDADYRKKGRIYGGAPHSLLKFPPGSRVLELGCGNGKTLSAMLNRGWNVTAIDFSPNAAQLARAVARPDPAAGIAIADAGRLPFRTGSFDAVIAIHVLGHSRAPGRESIVREIDRVIRPGGTVFFRDFSTRDFRFGAGNETEPGSFVRGRGILTHYFTEEEVRGIFAGFSTESLRHEEWELRVRGTAYPRSEIVAVFNRDACRR